MADRFTGGECVDYNQCADIDEQSACENSPGCGTRDGALASAACQWDSANNVCACVLAEKRKRQANENEGGLCRCKDKSVSSIDSPSSTKPAPSSSEANNIVPIILGVIAAVVCGICLVFAIMVIKGNRKEERDDQPNRSSLEGTAMSEARTSISDYGSQAELSTIQYGVIPNTRDEYGTGDIEL